MKRLLLFVMIFSLAFLFPYETFAKNSVETLTLNNCVDGNSARFMLGLGEIKVKFIGIESEDIIKDDGTDEINDSLVSDYVCESLKSAKKIKIEYEPNAASEDKYGRIQAWVFVDDVLLQEDLVSLGYSKIMYLNDNYKYAEQLKEAQKKAKEMRLGVWKDEKEEIVEDVNIVKNEKPKGFFETIIDFFKRIFNSLLSFIDDLIDNIL